MRAVKGLDPPVPTDLGPSDGKTENASALINTFIDAFYARVLADPLLSPVFIEVARIELSEHLPRIKAYWRKMLLGESGYDRHMMREHRAVDRRQPFAPELYARWLSLFEETLDETSLGTHTETARQLARRIAGNMRQNIEQFRD